MLNFSLCVARYLYRFYSNRHSYDRVYSWIYPHLFIYREQIKLSIKSRRYIENSTRRIYTGKLSLYAVHATKVWALIKPTCIKRYLNVPWTDHPSWKRSAISVGRHTHLYHDNPS